jgi:hypothetical protein
MNTHLDKTQQKQSQSGVKAVSQKPGSGESLFQFIDNRPEVIAQRKLQKIANKCPQDKLVSQLLAKVHKQAPLDNNSLQKKENSTSLPVNLNAGNANLSGYSMEDMKNHGNCDKPAQFIAAGYEKGTAIHLASGQDKSLPHKAWHVRPQKPARESPIKQRLKKMNNNARASSALVQRAPWNALSHGAEVAETNAQNARLGVAPPHPVQIGAQQDPANALQTIANEKHFDPEMRNEIRDLLNYLPASHIVGNPSLARIICEEANAANPGISFFGGNTLHVVVPANADSWLYLSVDKWPLGDLITTLMTNAGYAQSPNNPHVGHKATEVLGRDVVGTGTIANKLSMIGDNFVDWMLKHETGHSVDSAIQWEAGGHYRQPWAASWMKHDGTDQTEIGMMNSMIAGLGLNAGVLDAQYMGNTGANYVAPILQNVITNKNPAVFDVAGRNLALAGYDAAVPGGRAQVEFLENVIKEGLDSPWQKGGKGGIPFGGRNYHVEYQHSLWVSYNANRYVNRNSNYQYSGPEEWFAESYAHYFKHSNWKVWRTAHSQWGEKIKDPVTRAWFLANLDPINGPGALIIGNVLQPIAGAGPIIAPAGPVAVPAVPGILNKIGTGFLKVAKLGVSGLFRILSTVFGIAGGVLKYLLYVPARMLWRKIFG